MRLRDRGQFPRAAAGHEVIGRNATSAPVPLSGVDRIADVARGSVLPGSGASGPSRQFDRCCSCTRKGNHLERCRTIGVADQVSGPKMPVKCIFRFRLLWEGFRPGWSAPLLCERSVRKQFPRHRLESPWNCAAFPGLVWSGWRSMSARNLPGFHSCGHFCLRLLGRGDQQGRKCGWH